MSAASLLCRHSSTELVGAAFDQSSNSVLVTVQGDGIAIYGLEQKQRESIPLGARSNLEFHVASVRHTESAHGGSHLKRSIFASVVHDRASKSYTLCFNDSSSSAKTISDAASRVPLPGPAHSCHILSRQQQSDSERGQTGHRLTAAVVLADGRVCATELSPESTNPLSILSSTQSPAPRYIFTASTRDTLVTATQQSAGSPISLCVLRPSSGATSDLSIIKSLQLPCPGAAAHAVPISLTLSSSFALLQWSNAHATVIQGLAGGATMPLRPSNFPLTDTVNANGASSSAPAAAATGASARKRKNAVSDVAGTAGSRPRVLCSAVDDKQFVVLDFESAAAQSEVCFSLHDAQFGCPLSSGVIDIDAPLLSLDPMQCSVVASGPDVTVVRLGGALHALHVQTQPVSLLSLVARLSLSASAAAAAATASAAAGKPKAQAVGGRSLSSALLTLPTPVKIDSAFLASASSADTAATSSSALALPSDGPEDPADLSLQPVPSAALSRVEDICTSLVDQLSAVLPPAVPPPALLDTAVSYMAGRRQHAMAVPPQLPSLTARGLAAGKLWAQLETLLNLVPSGVLTGCSQVLVAVVEAQQYRLVSRLVTCLDEVEPEALVTALEHLLAPTTRANLPARREHYVALRAAAEKRIAEAEATAAAEPAAAAGVVMVGAATPGGNQRRGRGGPRGGVDPVGALAVAQCAAAAVDGFSYREALLHSLLALPVDAPAVQVALWRLGAPAVDALLSYLAKWLTKYTGGALSEPAAFVALPQELLFPYYHQVLEWTRMTIDSHLTRLLMARTPLPALLSIEKSLQKALAGAKRLLMLRGALEHMQAGAPLPSAHIAVATQYTAEVLDLRVR